jgi:hypothetical protein
MAGAHYMLTARHRRYHFEPIALRVDEELSDIMITSSEL